MKYICPICQRDMTVMSQSDKYIELHCICRFTGSQDIKSKDIKKSYAEYVYLTDNEYEKLCDQLGKVETLDYIQRVNDYAGQIGEQKFKRYKSHYSTILNWNRRDCGRQNVYKKNREFDKYD